MYLDKVEVKSRNKSKTYEQISGLLMSIAPVLGFILFGFIPMLLAIYMAFCHLDGRTFEALLSAEWTGVKNFASVINDQTFWKSVGNTFLYSLSLPICLVISLVVSFLLTKNVKGKKLFRTIYFIPYVCSVVAVVLMWKYVFDPNWGVVNSMLRQLGYNGETILWTSEEKYYRVLVIVMGVWGGCGYSIILYSAALTNVNSTFYEAAKIDGANPFQIFFHITLPAISPTTFYLLITGLIGSLQAFAATHMLSGSSANGATGPNNAGLTMGVYIYRSAFQRSEEMGQACAAAWVLAIMIMIITIINFKVSNKWVSYD